MNALEQEYAENVKRAARRENTRVVALAAAAIGVGAIGATTAAVLSWDTSVIFIALIGVVFGIADRYVAYATRSAPEPADDEPIQIEGGYREAPIVLRPAKRRARSKTGMAVSCGAIALVAGFGVALVVANPLARYSGHVIVTLGAVVIVAGQQVYAVWKKRHDAKLMLEWERRLEEMK